MSNWTEVNNVQTTIKDGSTYVIGFKESTTLRYTSGHQTIVVRIKFKTNRNVSSSYDDISVELLTKTGWVFIANDTHIQLKWPAESKSNLENLQETSKIWHEACKKYIEEIATVLR